MGGGSQKNFEGGIFKKIEKRKKIYTNNIKVNLRKINIVNMNNTDEISETVREKGEKHKSLYHIHYKVVFPTLMVVVILSIKQII